MVSIFGSAFWIPWTAHYNTIKNNILINCSQLVAFLGPNDNNVFEGNEEVTLTDVPSPFPSPSPSPEPTPTPEQTPATSPTPTTEQTPTSTPSQEPQQTEFTTNIGLAVIIIVLGAGLGLLFYLIKRK